MRQTGRPLVVVSLIAGLMAVAGPAQAEDLSMIEASGTVISHDENADEDLRAAFSIGDVVVVTVDIDPTTPDEQPSDPTLGYYTNAVQSASILTDTFEAQFEADFGNVLVRDTNTSDSIGWGANRGFGTLTGDAPIGSAGWTFSGINNLRVVGPAGILASDSLNFTQAEFDSLAEGPQAGYLLEFRAGLSNSRIGIQIESVSYKNPSQDEDGDGVLDGVDNCLTVINPDQNDADSDGAGDACDTDDDNDGVADVEDAFPLDPTESSDFDGDGKGDNADLDDDNDGQSDVDENACGSDPLDPSSISPDFDADQTPDCVDTNDDNDGVNDTEDLCPMTSLYDFSSTSDVGINRYALVGETDFYTNTAQNAAGVDYSTSDTGGCSGTQIADALGLGKSHYEMGITRSVLESWIGGLNG